MLTELIIIADDIARLEAYVELLSWIVAGLATALVMAFFIIVLLVILLKKP